MLNLKGQHVTLDNTDNVGHIHVHATQSVTLRPIHYALRCRQALHDRFGLPANRPLLRMNNAVDPRSAVGPPKSLLTARAARLQDVHVGIDPPPVAGGTVHMIEGSYDYHHYMQVCVTPDFYVCVRHFREHVPVECRWHNLQSGFVCIADIMNMASCSLIACVVMATLHHASVSL